MNTEDKEVEFYKILIVGDSGVGKSSVLSRFATEAFDENISNTVGIDYKTKDIVVNNKTIKLRIWDSAG
jgi:small GTP-binding protein